MDTHFITKYFFKEPFHSKSLISESRLVFLENMLKKVCYEKIDGDVIELGVYRGGSLIRLAKALNEVNSTKMIYGLDTFEGMKDLKDYDEIKHKYRFKGNGYNNVNLEKLKKIILKMKLENIDLMKGKFTDSFVNIIGKKFCFAFLDCSLYQSYKDGIEYIYPRLSKGGVMFFDDYNSHVETGTNKAIEENKQIYDNLVVLPHKQAYYIHK